ncbi:unnamed protein product, partial [Caenorhabditis brenneri]
FDVQNVPVIFRKIVQSMSSIRTISITCGHLSFSMSLNGLKICFERNAGGLIEYGDGTNKKTTSTTDPEKSVIDHLWFVLRDPNLKLNSVGIQTNFVFDNPLISFERILSSIIDSFDHQLYTSALNLHGLNEDTFVSFLKRVEPKTLQAISFDISWKAEGNYEKMKEIVETEQWKQASRITSLGISPLTVDDVLPFEQSYLCCEKITPEDVVRVRDHFSESRDERYCTLSALRPYEKKLDYNEFKNALQSENLHTKVINQLTKKMNQLTVPYEEIENRLAICCFYLLDKKRSSEEAYESLMEKLGTKLMEYSEFDYWFKRFQNNKFDLGYDTSLDSKEISEIQNAMISEVKEVKDVSTMTIKTEASVKVQKNVRFQIDEEKENRNEAKIDKEEAISVVVTEKNVVSETDETAVIPKGIAPKVLKNADYRFDVQNVPVIFQEIVQSMSSIKTVRIFCAESYFSMSLNELEIIRFERNADGLIEYGDGTNKKTFHTTNPEKSVIDHLWFVLRDPNLTLNFVGIQANFVFGNPLINFERILSSMLDSFDNPLYINDLQLNGLNEDTFVSFLKCVKPKKLTSIWFDISWKEEGNYEKMKEIVETEQWKQASCITSLGLSPLTVDDVLPFEQIYLCCDQITPEDVICVRDHFSESRDKLYCTLSAFRFYEKKLDYDEFENALRSENLHTRLVRKNSIDYFYTLPHSKKFLKVTVSELTRRIDIVKTHSCN